MHAHRRSNWLQIFTLNGKETQWNDGNEREGEMRWVIGVVNEISSSDRRIDMVLLHEVNCEIDFPDVLQCL